MNSIKGTYALVIILGRLGKDVETKSTPAGITVTNMSLATNWKSNDTETTEWHNIVVFGKSAEYLSKYAQKGDLIRVTGNIKTKVYEKDGQKKYYPEIIANDVQIIISKKNEQNDNKQEDVPTKDDLPF